MLFLLATTVVAAIAAWTDLRSGTIPNWLTFGTLAAGIVSRAVVAGLAFGWKGALLAGLYSVAGAILCGLIPFAMFWMGGAGGGDVKLFAALGALCQPVLGLEIETYSFGAAAILAPMVMAYRGTLLATLKRTLSLILNPLRPAPRREAVPRELMSWFRMGPAVFVGAAASLLLRFPWGSSPWLR